METLKFPAIIDFNFHWKDQDFKLKLQTSDHFLFLSLNGMQPVEWIVQTRKAFATRAMREDS